MSATMNRVILLGTLGADPEVRERGDKTFASMRIATNFQWKTQAGERKEETTWHRIEVSGITAQNCAKYLRKGRQILVEGRIRTRDYEKDGQKRTITEIVADSVKFMSNGNGSNSGNAMSSSPARATANHPAAQEIEEVDPF